MRVTRATTLLMVKLLCILVCSTRGVARGGEGERPTPQNPEYLQRMGNSILASASSEPR